ncbi:MAG: hypothetical protein H7230_00345 [Candidatus Parcubacteria bacterium]|nr:hypothetical protein [Candidatus Paceibacterota bacterium]
MINTDKFKTSLVKFLFGVDKTTVDDQKFLELQLAAYDYFIAFMKYNITKDLGTKEAIRFSSALKYGVETVELTFPDFSIIIDKYLEQFKTINQ